MSDLQVILAMKKYGGGFASALAQAALLADSSNLERIKTTWADYWVKYTELAKIDKARKGQTNE